MFETAVLKQQEKKHQRVVYKLKFCARFYKKLSKRQPLQQEIHRNREQHRTIGQREGNITRKTLITEVKLAIGVIRNKEMLQVFLLKLDFSLPGEVLRLK